MTYNGNVLNFTYDASGTPLTVEYNGTVYYYVTNLQGDVVAILDSNGASVVQYSYNAWGHPLTQSGTLSDTLGTHNPLRYRGYVFDPEYKLYYLESRYYNSGLGRFQNADSVYDIDAGLQGYNLYIYCGNNPVNRIDTRGTDSELFDRARDILDAMTFEGGGQVRGSSNGGNGTGSMIGDIVYISNKQTGIWNFITSIWDVLFKRTPLTQTSNTSKNSDGPMHTKGTTSPKNVSNPGGSYTQYGSNKKIYAYAQYDEQGRQSLRIDFQGKPHHGVLPHIHIMYYNKWGLDREFIYDTEWTQIQ